MDTECILWTGRLNEHGYGTIGSRLAHRVAWAKANGPIEAGLTIDHLCHDPEVCTLRDECPHRRCVNTAHMRLVTAAVNRARVAYHKPACCPKGHPYEGDNLLVSNGLYYCRTCRRSSLRARRAIAKVENCRRRGHERDEVTGEDGRAYCRICITENAIKATRARWG